MTQPPASSQDRLKPGQAIGNYTLIEPLEHTRLTSAFKARDQLLGKIVRLTQLHPAGSANDATIHSAVSRYNAAYKPIAAANDRLANTIDTLLDPSAGVCVISEHLQGLTLTQMLTAPAPGSTGSDAAGGASGAEGAVLDVKRTLGIVAAAAMGLAKMHERGLAHGCLTPDRIMLVGTNQLKVTEPGYWILIDPQYLLSLGVVPYAAPELMAGDAPSARSDFYALGMMAYQALAGPEGYSEVFKAVLRDERNQALRWMKWQSNPKVSAPPLHTINPNVPEPVSELIARMIDKTPTARLSQADVLIQAIQRHVIDQPTPVPGSATGNVGSEAVGASQGLTPQAVAPAQDTSQLPKQRRIPAVLGISIALWVCLIGAVGGFWLNKVKQERAAFVEPINNQIQITANLIQDGMPTLAVVEAGAAVTLAAQDATMARIAQSWHALALGNAADANRDYAAARKHYSQALSLNGFRNPQTAQQLQIRLSRAIDNAAFADGVDRINQAITSSNFKAAQEQIDAWRPLVLDDQEARSLSRLENDLADAMGTGSVESVLARVDDWLAANRHAEALDLLQRQLDRGNTSPQLLERYRQLSRQSGVAQYVEDAQEAAGRSDFTAAVAAYDQALRLSPSDSNIRQARNRAYALDRVAQARQALSSGQTGSATNLLSQALAADPNNTEASRLRSDLTANSERAALIAQADLAVLQRQWNQAIEAYTQALSLTNGVAEGDTLQDKLRDTRVDQALDEASQALSQNDVTLAQAKHSQATKLNANHPRVIEFTQTLNQHIVYTRHLTEGRLSMEQGKFGPATTSFLRARKILRTQQIDALIEEARFENLLAQTRTYIAQGNARDAAAMLATLRSQKPDAQAIPDLQSKIDAIK